MPDREKVIKGLECCAGQCNYHGCPYKDQCENANGIKQMMLDAIAVLKEHESAEPDPTEHIAFGTNRKCSSCGEYLFPAGRYCPHCGKAVKWE